MPNRSSDPVCQTDTTNDGHFSATERGAVSGGDEGLRELGGRQVVCPPAEQGYGEEGTEEERGDGMS